jgi:hypothetical protein
MAACFRGDGIMRTRLVAAPIAAAIAVLLSACGRSNTASMDEGLKQDLAAAGGSSVELAPKSMSQQLVVSAIEGGPKAAPARASSKKATTPKPIMKRTQQPTRSVAQVPTTSPATAPVVAPSAPVEASPVEPAPLPPIHAPVVRQPTKRQTGPYKTEAEIFREMPWIRP